MAFLFQLFYSSVLLFFFIFSSCLLNFTIFMYSLKFVEHLYDHHLNSLLGRFLISTLFSFSSEVLPSLFGMYSPVSSFCLILCDCFYVLYRLVTFSVLGEVALHRKPPIGLSSTLSSGHQSYML